VELSALLASDFSLGGTGVWDYVANGVAEFSMLSKLPANYGVLGSVLSGLAWFLLSL
jgi:hypothetical protein